MVNRRNVLLPLAVILIVVTIIIVLNLTSGGQEMLAEEFFAMDTVMDITLYETDKSDESLRDVMTEVRDRIYETEREFSVTDPKSDVSRINAANGEWVTVSEDTWKLLQDAGFVSDDTNGAFDPTIYPIVRLWGFTTGEYRVPSKSEIEKELKKVGWGSVETNQADGEYKVRLSPDTPGGEIDLGACAKGFLSDSLSELLRAHGVNGVLSLGGNVQTVGTKPDGSDFVVGITDPGDGTSIYKKVIARDCAVVTSGNYERYFEQDGVRYHHIMDSRTGAPADSGLASITVIGESGLYCDAYATAFFVMGEERTRDFLKTEKKDYKVIMIRNDGSSWQSDGIAEAGAE
ncbi:MAG: FAD:protein FMN transferase [Eubacterium sp.]|nr:FAD:protein FMN transferase [Eubacterium sp.]